MKRWKHPVEQKLISSRVKVVKISTITVTRRRLSEQEAKILLVQRLNDVNRSLWSDRDRDMKPAGRLVNSERARWIDR